MNHTQIFFLSDNKFPFIQLVVNIPNKNICFHSYIYKLDYLNSSQKGYLYFYIYICYFGIKKQPSII